MVSIGAYEELAETLRAAWKAMLHSPWDSADHAAWTLRHDALKIQRETYLRDLLGRLPFRWHIAHAYTPNETATHGGADHIVVDEPVHIGRLYRAAGDALSRPLKKFWGLHSVEEGRLPTSLADIKIAERIVVAHFV